MAAGTADDLKLLIRSRHPFVMIETFDEQRAADLTARVAGELALPLYDWTVTEGLCRALPTLGTRLTGTEPAKGALGHAAEVTQPSLYLFRSLITHLRDPVTTRQFQDLYKTLADRGSTAILLEASAEMPESIRRLTVPFALSWPDADELFAMTKRVFHDAKARHSASTTLDKAQVEHLVGHLRGLTLPEAERLVRAAVFDDLKLDPADLPKLLDRKRAVLAAGGLLDHVAADVDLDGLGGLANLKAWLLKRKSALSKAAREFGLEPPRGILLLGVQGCGKSLCAKVTAACWSLPLLRLDPGVLYQKWVGETEGRLRQALAQAEAMSPSVLLIDEIEKAFASASADSSDGGLSQRMFGSLLSWMQDRKSPVFLVATANDISKLPPELMRKGRFDEIFFVDLPDAAARIKVFEVHLSRRKRDPAGFDLGRLAASAEGFSGAEIEQAVVSGLYTAFSRQGELTTEVMLEEIAATRPLSRVMAEKIDALREWAKDRCVKAD